MYPPTQADTILISQRLNMLKLPFSPFRCTILLLAVLLFAFSLIPNLSAHAQSPVVRAVLFYSPTCGHCHKVMDEDLPPLRSKYGNQLIILEVNTSTPQGQELYNAAQEIYKPPSRGVPLMLVGQNVLLGSFEIPTRLPELIETGLQSGGIPWPDLPGLSALTPLEPEPITQAVVSPLWLAKFIQDPVGNGLAVVVLMFMVFSVVSVAYSFVMSSGEEPIRVGFLRIRWPHWTVPVLSIAGIVVAGYLSFGEFTQSELVCGPVGDCNAVQQSSYATLWGVLPVGILGMFGFIGILSAWLVHRFAPLNFRKLSALGMWGMALVGVLFSMYLTFLEPFVIGATCIWCITTATIITLLLWVTTRPVLEILE